MLLGLGPIAHSIILCFLAVQTVNNSNNKFPPGASFTLWCRITRKRQKVKHSPVGKAQHNQVGERRKSQQVQENQRKLRENSKWKKLWWIPASPWQSASTSNSHSKGHPSFQWYTQYQVARTNTVILLICEALFITLFWRTPEVISPLLFTTTEVFTR